MVLLAIAYFILGTLTGAILTIAVTIYVSKQYLTKSSSLKKDPKLIETVGERLKKVRDITTTQLSLQSQVEIPQKNGLDGKYKNGLIKEVKRLEEEKSAILRSILGDGFDPEITAMTSGGEVKQMKLSEFMAEMGIEMPKSEPEPEQKTSNIVKLTVHRGGKFEDDDGDGEPTH